MIKILWMCFNLVGSTSFVNDCSALPHVGGSNPVMNVSCYNSTGGYFFPFACEWPLPWQYGGWFSWVTNASFSWLEAFSSTTCFSWNFLVIIALSFVTITRHFVWDLIRKQNRRTVRILPLLVGTINTVVQSCTVCLYIGRVCVITW